ncbi:transketolase C-terminal domain-containing protein [Streptomyces sp. NRRL WC-3725]|uniref:transketolase C-terminal domain-containing protein n=1 Tax=Streptomyces sp. NRRL WC-3725 TaxID=1463933 RepID=UPI00099B7F85|nr:transketolase C-terminal domain-containing protein [Streptomyces sp. NRRL WC-3725]
MSLPARIKRPVDVRGLSPLWLKPLPGELTALAADHALVVTGEDGLRHGGVGTAVGQALQEAGIRTPVRALGAPTGFPGRPAVPRFSRRRAWRPGPSRTRSLGPCGTAAAAVPDGPRTVSAPERQ